jgi:hypothetical protein
MRAEFLEREGRSLRAVRRPWATSRRWAERLKEMGRGQKGPWGASKITNKNANLNAKMLKVNARSRVRIYKKLRLRLEMKND